MGLIKPKSVFSRPQQLDTPSSKNSSSPANTGRKKLAKVVSFTRLQRILAETKNFGRDNNAAVALRNIIKRELEERLQKQEKENYDLGEKITAMCISKDGKSVILATHDVDLAPKIKINPLETIQTEKTEENLTKPQEERNLLNLSIPFNNEKQNAQLTNDDNADPFIQENSMRPKFYQPPVLWHFDLETRVFERLPLDDSLETEKEITCLAMTNDNKQFLYGLNEKSIHLYDLEKKTRIYTFQNVCKRKLFQRQLVLIFIL